MTRYTAGRARNVGAVYLNGEQIWDCIEADDEHGFLIRYLRDEAGALIIDGDRIKTEVLVGKVQIVFKEAVGEVVY